MRFFTFPTKEEAIKDFLIGKSAEEVRRKKSRVNYFGAIILLILVIARLLNRFNLFPLKAIDTLWRFWPIFLIMALLQLFFRKYRLISLAVLALGIGLIFSVFIYSGASINSPSSRFLRSFYLKVSNYTGFLPINPGAILSKEDVVGAVSENINSRQINITLETGKIKIIESSDVDNLTISSSYYEKIGAPIVATSETSDLTKIDITSQFDLGALLGGVEDLSYDVKIGNSDLSTDLNVYLGAATLDAKFSNLSINNLTLDLGAGNANIEMDNLPDGEINLFINAGLMQLKYPYRSFVKVNYDIGTGILRINDKILKQTGSYTTTNFRITDSPTVINLRMNVGEVYIDTRGGE